ncbi:restriction endonuclease subunit S [Shewanella atlantica]|uniref:Restriction endonuclease subunit S n=1 Tax=Shewanella atlantica TaxID=271099 RepID=A0A431WH08_9GAMM|nr:restriction endonuclease subunit S [Shewanella atlantica]RTR34755.1 restriction endonuclease subunit S [Shewanella atlantica]
MAEHDVKVAAKKSSEQLITENLDIWTSAIEQKSASGRGSSKKFSLHGIKKLRELILELAVRGKLVPQDEKDEPASVLLERIAAEKAQLVKDKKIKKPKALPEISEDEKPFELPKGWEWGRVNELSKQVTDGVHHTPKYIESGVPFISVKDIDGKTVSFADCKYISQEQHEEINQRCNPELGDILLCRIGTLGRATIVDTSEPFSLFVSVGLLKFFNESLLPEYLHRVFHSPLLLRQYDEIKAGGSHTNKLNLGDIPRLWIPVAPLEEQHRIAAKVDELMSLCDALEAQTEASLIAHQTLVETLLGALLLPSADANSPEQVESPERHFIESWQCVAEYFDTLFTTSASIDTLKQTILQLAVMGKLVEQNSNDEPAAKLLERITAEKEQLIKDKKIKKQKPLPTITDEEKPFELPQGWEWVRFGSIAITRLGKMLDKAKNSGKPLPYLRNTNVQWHKFVLDDVKLMKFEDSELEEFRVQVGDLLICEGGEPGRCAIWSNPDMEVYFQKAIHRARPLGGVMSNYLQLCLTVDAGIGVLDEYFTGATIKHFVGAKLNSYIHSLPPLEEQNRIVAKADELMALCDQLKARLSDAQTTQLHLTDAIVEQAV